MHHCVMRTHAEIVAQAGSTEEVALARGVSTHTVRSWVQRDSIPAEHWAAFASDGKATLAELAEYAASNPRKRPTEQARDAA